MNQLDGKTIVAVRMMTEEEADALHWPPGDAVLELEDGSIIFATGWGVFVHAHGEEANTFYCWGGDGPFYDRWGGINSVM